MFSAFVRVDWRFRVDFRLGMAAIAGVVRFWLSLFGDGAISSDVVDELSSLFELLVSFIFRLVLRRGVSVVFSVCRLIPRVGCSL